MISESHKFIFIHIPKCAGTSIENALRKYCKRGFLGYDKNLKGFKQHANCEELLTHNHITTEVCNSFFKFAFVRNPFDRAVSIYKYIQKQESAKCRDNFILSKTFKQFAATNLISESGKNSIWFSDQYSQVKDCDFIGRFETLQADFDIVCQKLGITRNPLPVKNTTKHEHYSEYYDEETIEIVARKYHADIIRFGYKFEKPA